MAGSISGRCTSESDAVFFQIAPKQCGHKISQYREQNSSQDSYTMAGSISGRYTSEKVTQFFMRKNSVDMKFFSTENKTFWIICHD